MQTCNHCLQIIAQDNHNDQENSINGESEIIIIAAESADGVSVAFPFSILIFATDFHIKIIYIPF